MVSASPASAVYSDWVRRWWLMLEKRPPRAERYSEMTIIKRMLLIVNTLIRAIPRLGDILPSGVQLPWV